MVKRYLRDTFIIRQKALNKLDHYNRHFTEASLQFLLQAIHNSIITSRLTDVPLKFITGILLMHHLHFITGYL